MNSMKSVVKMEKPIILRWMQTAAADVQRREPGVLNGMTTPRDK